MTTHPLVIAHRGASARWPENTVAAFSAAAELGADWVELDVRPAESGALVVSHDPVLADGRVVAELAPSALPSSMPSLDEALVACGALGVNVEIKNDPSEPGFDGAGELVRRVLQVVERRLDPDRCLVSCFHRATLDQVRVAGPSWPTGFLFYLPLDAEAVDGVAGAGHRAVNPHHLLVDEALMSAARERGLAVYPWTVDDPDRIVHLAELGVDGIITNVPDVARAALAGR